MPFFTAYVSFYAPLDFFSPQFLPVALYGAECGLYATFITDIKLSDSKNNSLGEQGDFVSWGKDCAFSYSNYRYR
ncbi:hypothetical protein Aazo_0002 ['Nostoc azollae' 0708]|jgi:hypothetical protein|uniref:Uncharacterized protein n=1 Tax=Nostoc azollae (strain 0708) TaxID=551115 RepID=D7DVL8_NOSA0|nr:hypothetical protein Aazo_0002 ['Nostoc azollae' 0708]